MMPSSELEYILHKTDKSEFVWNTFILLAKPFAV